MSWERRKTPGKLQGIINLWEFPSLKSQETPKDESGMRKTGKNREKQEKKTKEKAGKKQEKKQGKNQGKSREKTGKKQGENGEKPGKKLRKKTRKKQEKKGKKQANRDVFPRIRVGGAAGLRPWNRLNQQIRFPPRKISGIFPFFHQFWVLQRKSCSFSIGFWGIWGGFCGNFVPFSALWAAAHPGFGKFRFPPGFGNPGFSSGKNSGSFCLFVTDLPLTAWKFRLLLEISAQFQPLELQHLNIFTFPIKIPISCPFWARKKLVKID